MSGTTVPVVVTAAGLTPTPPATLLSELLTAVAAQQPGYTANLPGLLIEDISSTDVGALSMIDSALVDLVNSVTPYGVNDALIIQLGNVYGVSQISASNTSVYVVFSSTAIGFVIPIGFTVSDGTYQYVVQDGGAIGTGGVSPQIYCLATSTGSWAVPIGTVTALATSLPSQITMTVTNPATGTPGGTAESFTDYRVRVLKACLAPAQGMASYLKQQLGTVSGVQPRLIAVQQQTGATGGWKILVGGGDPYAVANAIFDGVFDVSTLVGSTLSVTGITQANPGVVTTNLNHGFTTGQVINIAGIVGMTALNNTPLTITVITQKTFSVGVNTTSYGAWVSGGVATPNFRNITVAINDYPDTYQITFVNPPQQTVTLTLTWGSNSSNYVSPAAIAQAGGPALLAYINALPAGVPMNIFAMEQIFQTAIAAIIPAQLLTRMVWAININGVSTAPSSGTGIVAGDPESFFFATLPGISIVQG